MRFLLACLITTMVAGCAYPTTSLRVPDERPSIAIQGAPRDAVLYVDGLNMGPAKSFDGASRALLLEPGPHRVEVKSRDRLLLSEKIFLGGGEMRTIVVTGADVK